MKMTTGKAIKLMVAVAVAASLLSGCLFVPPEPPHDRDHGGDYHGDRGDRDDRGR